MQKAGANRQPFSSHPLNAKIGALTSIAAVAVSLPLAAHHSFSAEFDASKEIRATGAVMSSELSWAAFRPLTCLHYVEIRRIFSTPNRRPCVPGISAHIEVRGAPAAGDSYGLFISVLI